ncbi:MAG: hypothetical protein DSZ23_03080 [Thermodesulfatator sp.]|nr:MAG: hypothetical protein DSZ23_03080 [Thermodesulfatator sp.]
MHKQRLKKIARFIPLSGENPACPWLWAGTWSLAGMGYGGADYRISKKCLEFAFEKGIRHFDTAGFYGKGASERLIGEMFSSNRKEIFVSSKGGLVWDGNRVFHRAKPKALEEQLFQSMERLQTDYIDLFQLHWPDPAVPLDESFSALADLQERGLIRFWGAGNLTAEQIFRYIPEGSLTPVQTTFNPCRPYNLHILDQGFRTGRTINCIISPFEQGLLVDPQFLSKSTGKKDVRSRNPLFSCRKLKDLLCHYFQRLENAPIGAPAFILLWLLGFRPVDIIIPGPRTPEQVSQLMAHVPWIVERSALVSDIHEILRKEVGEDFFALLDQIGKTGTACLKGQVH